MCVDFVSIKRADHLMNKTLFLLTCFLSANVLAQDQIGSQKVISTDELMSYCSDMYTGGRATCTIYIQGAYDTYQVTRDPVNAPEFICINQPAPPREKVVEDFVVWTKSHAEFNAKPASEAILKFLADKFPCSKKNATNPPALGRSSAQNVESKTSIEEAKSKCADLGLKKGTNQFGNCVLKLTK